MSVLSILAEETNTHSTKLTLEPFFSILFHSFFLNNIPRVQATAFNNVKLGSAYLSSEQAIVLVRFLKVDKMDLFKLLH